MCNEVINVTISIPTKVTNTLATNAASLFFVSSDDKKCDKK